MSKPVRFPISIRRDSVVVKIYRSKHARTASGFTYSVAWTVGGKRYLLQRATLAKAQAEGAAKAEQLASGKFAAARDVTGDDVAALAAARRLCGNVPIIAALEEWSAARRLVGGSILPAAKAWAEANHASKPVNVPDAVKAFLSAKDRSGVDTWASYRAFLPKLKERFTGPIGSVSASALENWIHDTFKTGGAKHAHPVTFNTARKRLVALWRWCRKQGYLPRTAQTEAEQIEMAREQPLEIGILTVADFARVLVMLRDFHPGMLATGILAGFCGLRRSELHAQKWSDVHLDRSLLRISKAKRNTPSKRLVPLSAAAVEWLKLCDSMADLVATPWALDRIRTFAREAVPAIPCPENGFRHSFISYRVASTGNVAETALESGNSPAIIHKHYRELVDKTAGAAWFDLTPSEANALCESIVSNRESAAK